MNRIFSSLLTSAIVLCGAAAFQKFYQPEPDGSPAARLVFPGYSTDAELLALDESKRAQLLTVLNRGSVEEMEALPGISTVRGSSIIQSRPFNRPEDVVSAPGVGKRTFRKLVGHAEIAF